MHLMKVVSILYSLVYSDVVNAEGLSPGLEPGVPGLIELCPLHPRVLAPGGRGRAVVIERPAPCL